MKKVLLVTMVIFLLFLITACNRNKSTAYVGVNAEILEINNFVKGMVVKGLNSNSILGEKCYINCEGEGTYFIYVDFNTEEVTKIQFEDFIVGDEITVDITSVENKYALTTRVQLLTQRK